MVGNVLDFFTKVKSITEETFTASTDYLYTLSVVVDRKTGGGGYSVGDTEGYTRLLEDKSQSSMSRNQMRDVGLVAYQLITSIEQIAQHTDTDVANISLLKPPFYLVFTDTLTDLVMREIEKLSLTIIVPHELTVEFDVNSETFEGLIYEDVGSLTGVDKLATNYVKIIHENEYIQPSLKYQIAQTYFDSPINYNMQAKSFQVATDYNTGTNGQWEINKENFLTFLVSDRDNKTVLGWWGTEKYGTGANFYIEKQLKIDIQKELYNYIGSAPNYINANIATMSSIVKNVAESYLQKTWIAGYELKTPFNLREQTTADKIVKGLVDGLSLRFSDAGAVWSTEITIIRGV